MLGGGGGGRREGEGVDTEAGRWMVREEAAVVVQEAVEAAVVCASQL